MSSEIILKIENLSKKFRLANRPTSRLLNALFPYHFRNRSFTALENFSLAVHRGECIGVLGVNGSGKSTLLQLIAGILTPSSGRIFARGKVAALLELGSWIDMTDTGRENIFNAGYIFGLNQTEIEQQIPDIIEFSEIGDFIDQPVSTYSTGMIMRLAFSSCIYLESDILLLDEIFAVGDAHFAQKCIELLRQRINRTTVILVSHDTNIINSLCTRAVLLHHGKTLQIGAPREITERYLEICYSERQANQINVGEIATAEAEDFRAASRTPEIEVCPFSHDGRSFGEGRAQICDVALLSTNGDKLTSLKGGEKVILRLRAQVKADLTLPSLGFVVNSPDGLQLWGDSAYPGQDLAEIPAGHIFEASFEFVLPLLPQGTYTIGAAISSGAPDEHHVQEWCHRALTFSVKADLPIRGILFSPPVKNIKYQTFVDNEQ